MIIISTVYYYTRKGHHPTESAMKPRKLLGKAQTPDKAGELQLSQRGDDFFIAYNGKELMNSRMHGSEDLLAEFACKPIAQSPRSPGSYRGARPWLYPCRCTCYHAP